MAQTRADIATLALKTLKLVPEGQVPSASLSAAAKDGVTRAHAELAHHRIAYWDIDECPDGLSSALADYVAGDIAPHLADESRIAFYQARMIGAMRRMAAVTAKRDTSDAPVRIMDF